MNVLILAYASEPGAGSEYGVGWMVPETLAKLYPEEQFYVLTRSRCREKIEKVLAEKELQNLHFCFYEVPKWLSHANEMKSNWGEQINYLIWQLAVRKYAKKLHRQIGFSVVHHLTFNQYRTPSPGFWMNVPFVFGPIGGAETIAPAFWQDLEDHSKRKEKIRLKGRDQKIFRWYTTRKENKKVILCSCGENLRRLQPYAINCEVRLLPAIAYTPDDFKTMPAQEGSKSFRMLYAGKAWDWKGIHIFLKAVKKALADNGIDDWRVKLIGIRFKEEQEKVTGWIKELGLSERVSLVPFIQRAELLQLMSTCSISVYPAFRDSGSMSVLEASALGCPTICFNAGGQDVFPDNILLKVDVADDYETTMTNFANKLEWAYFHRDEIKEIGLRSQQWVKENMTWDKKADEFMTIYREMMT